MPKQKYFEGDTFGKLLLIKRLPGSRFLMRCECGRISTAFATNVVRGKTKSCGNWESHPRPTGSDHHFWKDEPGYDGAHARVLREWGPASQYPCVCGCDEWAQEWSYSRIGGPNERVENGLYYSVDPTDYLPRNAKHHRKFDKWTRALRSKMDKREQRRAAREEAKKHRKPVASKTIESSADYDRGLKDYEAMVNELNAELKASK